VRRRRHLALRRRAFLGTALLGLLVAAGWLVGRMLLSPGSAQVAPSIAVLPFADVSPQRDQEYFSDGLADEILNLLNRVEGLRVPSRTSSFYFKGRNAPLAEIGRELRVAAVLEGSVRTSGNRVRVSAQVVNVADGFRQWAATYDRELTDIFTVQDEIAQAVVAALDQKLLGGKALAASDRETGPEAYRLCLLGRQRAYLFTAGSLRLAAEAFEAALAIDPRYAPAWSGLAMALYHLSNVASTPAEISSLRRRAVAAAEKAVALSPNLPEALSTRGNLRGIVEHDWEGARRDLEGALAVNGNDSASRRRYATLLAVLGRLPEAIEQARKAADLDPLGEAWSRLGFLYQNAGELDLAAAAFRRDLAIHPGSLSGLVGLGRNLVLQGKAKEALALVRESPERVDRLFVQAAAHHLLGDRAASQAALEEMIATEAQTAALDIAEIHALRGESEAALGWLERSVLQRDGGLGIGLQTDPFLRSLRSRPRFLALLQKMNLPAPAEQPAPPK